MTKFFLKTLGQVLPSDLAARRFPVSIKGLICQNNKILLLKTEDGFWDLPGGKLTSGERPEDCLKREVREETGLDIKIGPLLDSYNLQVKKMMQVLVVVYQCSLEQGQQSIDLSQEHFDGQWFTKSELKDLKIREEYRAVMRKICG